MRHVPILQKHCKQRRISRIWCLYCNENSTGNVIPWLASQTDMLAEDWVVVEQIKLIFDERETDEEVTDGIDKRQWMSG